MPFSMQVSNIRRRPAMQAMNGGGFEPAETPNPNSGMATYERNNPMLSVGAHTSSSMPSGLNDPRRPMSMAALDAAAASTDQGDSEQYAAKNAAQVSAGTLSSADATQNERDDRMNKTAVQIMNPDARRFTQALYNADAHKLKAGPGFFADQDNRNLQRQSLDSLLKAKDLNSGRGY